MRTWLPVQHCPAKEITAAISSMLIQRHILQLKRIVTANTSMLKDMEIRSVEMSCMSVIKVSIKISTIPDTDV